jgi:hypothetical protein
MATGIRRIDKDQAWGFGLTLADEVLNVGLPGADAAEGDALSIVLFGDRGHRDGLFVHIQPNIQRARVIHG